MIITTEKEVIKVSTEKTKINSEHLDLLTIHKIHSISKCDSYRHSDYLSSHIVL